MTPRAPIALVASLLLLPTCASPRPRPEPVAGASAAADRRALDDHFAAWRTGKPETYSYHYRVDCFCPGGGRWYGVLVRGDQVVEAAALDPAAGGKGPALPAAAIPTVDSLFGIARRAYENGADSVAVSYAPSGHYPTRIVIDWRRGAVDDEVTYAVDSLVPAAGR